MMRENGRLPYRVFIYSMDSETPIDITMQARKRLLGNKPVQVGRLQAHTAVIHQGAVWYWYRREEASIKTYSNTNSSYA